MSNTSSTKTLQMDCIRNHVWYAQKLSIRLPLGLCVLADALPILFGHPVASSAVRNVTVAVPEGATDHGDPRLLCTPSTWTDVATFILANFIAHAETVKSKPGEPLVSLLSARVSALLIPSSGMLRGFEAIFQHAMTGSSRLQRAKKSGALCQVVRTPGWKPQSGDIFRDVRVVEKTTPQGTWIDRLMKEVLASLTFGYSSGRIPDLSKRTPTLQKRDKDLEAASHTAAYIPGSTGARMYSTKPRSPWSLNTETPKSECHPIPYISTI